MWLCGMWTVWSTKSDMARYITKLNGLIQVIRLEICNKESMRNRYGPKMVIYTWFCLILCIGSEWCGFRAMYDNHLNLEQSTWKVVPLSLHLHIVLGISQCFFFVAVAESLRLKIINYIGLSNHHYWFDNVKTFLQIIV